MMDGGPVPVPAVTVTDPGAALAALCLIRSRRVGAVTWHRLVAEHGTPAAALDALPGIARAAGVERYAPFPASLGGAELAAGDRIGARLLVHGTPDYPAGLAETPDAPPVLWALGDVACLQRPMVALVGARNASSLGLRMAKRLATDLAAAGQVVVSGLARGIDTAAHEAALDGGTLAVLAGGVDAVYPAENADLARRIAATGCLISEQPLGVVPQARHFPLRNRIIAGLSRAVLVIEAAQGSGSLLTAAAAAEYGREVLAVPGHPFDARAAGSNALIRDGATLVRGAADVLQALDLPRVVPARAAPSPAPAIVSAPGPDTDSLRARALALLGPSPVAEDDLLRDLGGAAGAAGAVLVALELEGRIERQAGQVRAAVA